MKKFIKLFIVPVLIVPFGMVKAASNCSKLSLIQCLDSACAYNININPGVRCQMCGSARAGAIKIDSEIQQLSIGKSEKNILSSEQLKSAPTDPGKRYIWATDQCIKKLPDCTTSDVNETYDKLIEQSCRAAGTDIEMTQVLKDALRTKSLDTCKSEMQLCITADSKCNSDYSNCLSDDNFYNFFSVCSGNLIRCDEFANKLYDDFTDARNTSLNYTANLIQNIANDYKTSRENKINSVKSGCENNNAFNSCVKTVCETNMKNKCIGIYDYERTMATLICGYYKIACGDINKNIE